MNIGQAAKASSVSAKLIRYYERIGLIQPEARTGGNYRSFGDREVNEFRFIGRAPGLGFAVEEIRKLLSLWRDPALSQRDVRTVAEGHLADLEARMEEMRAMAHLLRELAIDPVERTRPDFPALPGPVPDRPAWRRRNRGAGKSE